MSWPDVEFESIYASPSRNGVYKTKEFHGRGSRIVNMGEMFGYNFISNQDMKRVELSERELEANSLEDGDLLFGRRSLVEAGAGKCSLVVKPSDSLTFESSIIRVRLNKEVANPRFLYYYFLSPQGRGRIRSIVSGTNVKGIRGSDLKRLPVSGPPKSIQDEIAAILAAYDDLIENNRRRMALLEESARLLYREWFIRLRFPGHEHTRITDGVPEGWERLPFSQLAGFVNGYPFKPAELGVVGLPIVKIPELRDGVSDKTPRNEGENIPEKYLLNDGDLLFSWSGTLLIEFWYDGPAILNQHLFRVEPQSQYSRAFLLFALREALPEFSNQTVGATMKHIRKAALTTVTVCIPSHSLLTQFDELAADVFEQVLNLRRQNQKLRAARDLLLPRLMSGEIAV